MKKQIRAVSGKRVNGNLYFHVSALEELEPYVREQVQRAALYAGLAAEAEFNVIKIDEESQKISLLYYGSFFDNPFPALQRSCVVDIESGQSKLFC